MFESLSKKLLRTIDFISGRDKISESDVELALKEIKVALLEADVSIDLVRELMDKIREKAVGQKVLSDVSPANQIVKIVNDELVSLLGEKVSPFAFNDGKLNVILMVGLNGSGKTTTTAKLAKLLISQGKKVLMASGDIYRPQAREQLRSLGIKNSILTLPIIKDEGVMDIAKRALKYARDNSFDIIIFDSAGRISIDDKMMNEIRDVAKVIDPIETFLCVDSIMGQAGVEVAFAFKDAVSLTGIIMTRVDGDSRGGSSISMRAKIGVPIKFLGVGEKIDDIEEFFPDRIASRILGMGDIVSLVEQAQSKIDENEAKQLTDRMMSGEFDFNDMLSQFRQMKKLGNIAGIMKFLPGIGGMAEKIKSMGVNDDMIKRQEAMILSMTPKERKNPEIILMGRKKRIVKGSGVSLSDMEKLIKQYQKTKVMMEQMKKMGGMTGLMQMAKQMKDSGDFANMPDFGDLKS